MTLEHKLRSGSFIVTAEIGPPKGIDVSRRIDQLAAFAGRIDAVNVTDLQSSVMRLGSLAVCVKLKERGFEPVLQLTCRDRNRLALQSDLLSAAAFGIENISILTGDHPLLGDHPEAKPVFDLDSVQLLTVARQLEQGIDMNGHALENPFPRFCLGAVVNPGADPLAPEIIKMEKKVEAGARFLQTQAVFDVATFERFVEASSRVNVAVIAGIIVLKSAKMARYMNEHIAGVSVPDTLINEIETAPDKDSKGAEIAARIIRGVKPLCRGVHIMPMGRERLLGRVLDEAGLT